MAGDNIFNRSEVRIFGFKRYPVIGMPVAIKLDEDLNGDQILVSEPCPQQTGPLEIVSYHGSSGTKIATCAGSTQVCGRVGGEWVQR